MKLTFQDNKQNSVNLSPEVFSVESNDTLIVESYHSIH